MMSLARPLHPILTIWPVAFLSTAFALDALHPWVAQLPPAVLRYIPHGSEVICLSYYALGAGVFTSLPAMLSGILEANKLQAREGTPYEADGATLKVLFKRLYTHALLNNLTLLGSAYAWWTRRQAGGATVPPAPWMSTLATVLGPVLMFTGNLGGAMIWHHGAGMDVGATTTAKKTKAKKK